VELVNDSEFGKSSLISRLNSIRLSPGLFLQAQRLGSAAYSPEAGTSAGTSC
jgi:hypothetical protein